jgi:hypothetical protein
MGFRGAIAAAVLSAGCVTDTLVVEMELSADGVTGVYGDSDRGNFAYLGEGGSTEFDVEVTNWAMGFVFQDAKKLRKRNDWIAEVDGNVLDLVSRANSAQAGVDFVVEGPPVMDIDAVLVDGQAVLSDVEGDLTVSANGIVANRLRGSANLYASHDGLSVDIAPGPNGVVTLQAYGNVYLDLPVGSQVQLLVFADPLWGVSVADLGFDVLSVRPDYVAALSGEGTAQVEVWVSGGRFFLRPSDQRP